MDRRNVSPMNRPPKEVRKAKRNYRYINCQHCNSVLSVNQYTAAISCSKCKKVNFDSYIKNAPEADFSLDKNISAIPIRIGESKESYRKLRDEMQIRSDMYVNGKTRVTLGANRFRKELKRELIQNKCYRGSLSDVD